MSVPQYVDVEANPQLLAELHAVQDAQAAARDDEGDEEQHLPNLDQFWSRPSLAHLHDFARARRTSPWAVLGVALVRAVVATKPWVRLPALVGGDGSLNLFVALVGPSGSGKGAAAAVAREAIDIGEIAVRHIGSGEGIAHLFAHRDRKNGIIRDRDAVLLNVPEVDALTALSSRQGATLLTVLRSAWSGEPLGFANADPNRTIPIEEHTYRLGLVLGVQPARAGALLDDSDGGTPQRFLWLPTVDPDAPRERPAAPPARKLATHVWPGDMDEIHRVHVPQIAERHIDQVNYDRARGEGDPLDAHAAQCRLKAAQALALIDDRFVMTEDDWRLAGVLMRVSDRTREQTRRQLIRTAVEANVARARADGVRAAVAEETAYEREVLRVCKWITRYLDRHPDTARGHVRKAMPSRDRRHFDDATERLRDAGQITESSTEHGTRLSLAQGART